MSNCYGRGTGVRMADGSRKCIEDIRVGDRVLGNDAQPRDVVSVSRGSGPLYHVHLRTLPDGPSRENLAELQGLGAGATPHCRLFDTGFVCNKDHILPLHVIPQRGIEGPKYSPDSEEKVGSFKVHLLRLRYDTELRFDVPKSTTFTVKFDVNAIVRGEEETDGCPTFTTEEGARTVQGWVTGVRGKTKGMRWRPNYTGSTPYIFGQRSRCFRPPARG